MQDITNLPLDEALEKFINFKTAMNKAEATINYYNERFIRFRNFLKTEKGIEFTSQIYDECVTDFILYKRRCSPNLSDTLIYQNKQVDLKERIKLLFSALNIFGLIYSKILQNKYNSPKTIDIAVYIYILIVSEREMGVLWN